MSYTITNGILSCTFSISDKDSSGNFTISATITNTDSVTTATGNPRLSCSLDNSYYQRISRASLTAGSSFTGTTSFNTGNQAQGVVYCYLLTDNLSGRGGSYTVPAYVDPTPPFGKKSLTITPSTIIMGEALSISESSGTNVTSTSRSWSAASSSGSFTTGNWTASISTFEPLCPNATSLSVNFTTYSSGPGGSGSSTKTVTMNVPSDYKPSLNYYPTYIESINNGLIAGISSIELEVDPYMIPATNSATIDYNGLELTAVTSTNPALTVSSFTKATTAYSCTYTSTTLPVLANTPSYTFSLTFTLTDSRGIVNTVTTETFRVTNFVPPAVYMDTPNRSSSTTASISLSIHGESASHPTVARYAMLKIGDSGSLIDVSSNLVADATIFGYRLTYNVTGLTEGAQYNIYFYYQDETMYSYQEAAYTYKAFLSTMDMPLSLYDNGYNMFVSFGEEAADNYPEADSNKVINFAKGADIRVTDSNGNSLADSAYNVVSAPSNIITNILGELKFEALTAAEYEELVEEELVEDDKIYFVYEEE